MCFCTVVDNIMCFSGQDLITLQNRMKVIERTESEVKAVDFNNLEFGQVFADYMLVSDFEDGKWSEMSIEPLKPLSFHPATSVFHYGQAIFEGLKAYKCSEGRVNLFRLKDNLTRLNKSAVRMQIPQLDKDEVEEGIKKLVSMQKDWIPTREQGTMYLRPFVISTDSTLRALPSRSYKFMVIACPVGFYYDKPLNISLEKVHSRAANGGVGYAKAAGNYAASFYPAQKARNLGFDQILWTDISNNYTLEELGSANFFYVKNGEVYTPALNDSILKGITRETIITLATQAGLKVNEKEITAEEFESDLKSGVVDCMFATGTAAAITYVNRITIDSSEYQVGSDAYNPVRNLKISLDDSKYLISDANPQWNIIV